jgi:tRNA C32,U32 (ribose-2'-O)-methylase TrmJ
MKKYNIKLDKQQMAALKSFIERTELSGREVQVFMSVVQAINEAERIFDSPKNKKNIPKISA